MSRVTIIVIGLALAACGTRTTETVQGTLDGGRGTDATTTSEACERMDIVFVIDSSGSMQEEQDNLVANFGQFADLIHNYQTESGANLDYRIAITTAGRDVQYTLTLPPPFSAIDFNEEGDNGKFLQSCGMSRPWIERADGDVASTFSCVADVGTGGPGAEMPLLGLEWALGRRTADGTNAGFLRDDALLAVVMISDQDDCSREDDGFTIDGLEPTCFDPSDSGIIPLSHYLDFLDDLKGGRGRWATAVLAGEQACSSQFGDAAEAVRLKDFAAQTGDNAVFSSICSGDLTGALAEAMATFEAACEAFTPID